MTRKKKKSHGGAKKGSQPGRSRRPPGPGEMHVNGYSEQWIRKGFPWVYEQEVEAMGSPSPDGQVRVCGRDGAVLATGVRDSGWIAARLFRHGDGVVDAERISACMQRARDLRDGLIDAETTGYRLVHGENDDLPGIRVDWWSHFAVIVLDSPSLRVVVPWIVAWLEEHLKPRGIFVCFRPDPRDTRPFPPEMLQSSWVSGKPPAGEVRVLERGVRFDVRPHEGPDVGLYADMRDVRRWMEPHWGGKRVLNTFCYTGAFSVVAAMYGATEVVSVDLSARVLERAEQNVRANELDLSHHQFVQSDVFKALDRLRRTGERFDRVILDPPSFSTSKEGIWSAKRDYPRLVAAAFRVLEPGGWVLAASNQGDLSPKEFRGFLIDGARRAGCRAQELWWGGQGPDFPAGTWFPEGRYLKVGVWRRVEL